jgi:amicyanin
MVKAWYAILAVVAVAAVVFVLAPQRAPEGETPPNGTPPGAAMPAMGGIEAPPGIVVEPVSLPSESLSMTVSVAIRNFAFVPAEVRVAPGTRVVWTNEDAAKHNVVGDDGFWSGPLLAKGGSYEFTFPTKGTYGYYCSPHPFMKGTIVVE